MGQDGGRGVEIRSRDMRYWQVYTPEGGRKIAVEPMTFMGNVYRVYEHGEFGDLQNEGEFTIRVY